MAQKRKSFSPTVNMRLFREVDGLCPLCSKSLTYEKITGQTRKGYEIAHIYPLNPTMEETQLLSHQPRLSSDPNAIENLILLCLSCHNRFDNPRTVSEYLQLVEIKKRLMRENGEKDLWHEFGLKEQIRNVIQAVAQSSLNELVLPLSYDAVAVDDKSDDTLLPITKVKIKRQVEAYFSFVRAQLAELDSSESGISEVIASQVKTYYLELRTRTTNKQLIYETLVKWMHERTGKASTDACEVIVSFFVQNCEVFERVVAK